MTEVRFVEWFLREISTDPQVLAVRYDLEAVVLSAGGAGGSRKTLRLTLPSTVVDEIYDALVEEGRSLWSGDDRILARNALATSLFEEADSYAEDWDGEATLIGQHRYSYLNRAH